MPCEPQTFLDVEMDVHTPSEPLVDLRGHIMFWCDRCRQPISRDDILDLGMRVPDISESAQEYLDAELIDAFRHPHCIGTAMGG